VQGYTYNTSHHAWVCAKCAALVDDPVTHENSHEELVRAMTAWVRLLEKNTAPSAEVYDIGPQEATG